MVDMEGRRADEEDSLRRICLKPPSSMDVARDSDNEPAWEWATERYSTLIPSCTEPKALEASCDVSLPWVLKVCEAVRFMLGSRARDGAGRSSAADEVLGRRAMDGRRCICGCRAERRWLCGVASVLHAQGQWALKAQGRAGQDRTARGTGIRNEGE